MSSRLVLYDSLVKKKITLNLWLQSKDVSDMTAVSDYNKFTVNGNLNFQVVTHLDFLTPCK